MGKRPSIIGEIFAAPKPEPSTAPTPAVAPETPAKRKANPGVVHTSVYLPKAVHRKLREIAFTKDKKIHDIIMEGIDAALKVYGHQSVAELRER